MSLKTYSWLNKLERKFGRFAVPNLMNIIIMGMAIVFVMDMFVSPMTGKTPLSVLIYFDRDAIFHGQIWRLLSFVFLPVDTSPFFVIFTLYFYWLIGSTLEGYWGSFKFNVYYIFGIIGTIISGLITGFADNYYINMSLFIAFAMIMPNFQILLFFFIPIKIKYVAMFDAALMLLLFIVSDLSGKLAIAVSIINLLIFFGGDIFNSIKMRIRHIKYKISNRR